MLLDSVVGIWLFTSLIFQGQSMPVPNPSLKIYYEFQDTGINTLFYQRDGERGFCERRAAYEFSGNNLTQQVIWVNPANAPWCSQDLDMQLGYRSWTQAWLREGKFHLSVMMGEDQLIYVWSATDQLPPKNGPL